MPRVLSKADTYWVALEKLPQFAGRVGIVISFGSIIEMQLPRWLVKVTGVPGNHASIILRK